MALNLQNILKALLFSTSEPLSVNDLKNLFRRYEVDSETADEAFKSINNPDIEAELKKIEETLIETKDIYRLTMGPNGYSLALAPEYAPWIRLLRNEDKPIKLSPAAMETLALIAYRQPITRAEMELIRGVSADAAIQKLMDYKLIYIQGQANLPGKPRLYATTEAFLNFCGITCLEDLPSSDVLPKKQVTEWVQSEGKREIYSNQEMGLQ